MSYFDIGIIAVVVLFALLGLWKGFFKTLISFFGWTVSFLIAFFLTKPVANALLDVARIRHFVLGVGDGWSVYQWISGKLASDGLGFLTTLLKPLVATSEKAGVPSEIGVPLLLANGMFSAVVCLVMFLSIRLLMLLFTLFANAMTRDKFKGSLSRFLGFLIGAAKGGTVVCYVMVFFSFTMGLGFMAPARKQLDKSVIALPVYNQVVKFTDKYLAGDDDTLTKLVDLLGLEMGGRLPEEPEEPEEPGDPAPAYCGTYTGTMTQGDENPIVMTYTLVLDKNGTYTLTISVNDGSNDSVFTGTYDWDEENGTLTLHTGAGDEEYDIIDGAIDYDGAILEKESTGEEPGGEEPGGEEPGGEESGGEELGEGEESEEEAQAA